MTAFSCAQHVLHSPLLTVLAWALLRSSHTARDGGVCLVPVVSVPEGGSFVAYALPSGV